MDTGRNERIKLTASTLTKLSSVSILIGIFMPLSAWMFALPEGASVGIGTLVLSGALWIAVGAILFKLGMRLLRELR